MDKNYCACAGITFIDKFCAIISNNGVHYRQNFRWNVSGLNAVKLYKNGTYIIKIYELINKDVTGPVSCLISIMASLIFTLFRRFCSPSA